MGHANAIPHAIHLLDVLTTEGKADRRWTDEAAWAAVVMYRKLNPNTKEARKQRAMLKT